MAQEKFSSVIAFFDNIEQIIFNPKNLVLSTAVLPGNPILTAGATLSGLAAVAYLEENLPDDIRKVFNKIKALVAKVKDFLATVVKEKINEGVAVFNAFLCGLLNGLMSLLQFIVLLVGFVIDNIPILELEKVFSKEEINDRAKKLEVVEDILELLSDNTTQLLGGFIKTLITLPRELYKFVLAIKKKLTNVSRYFIAYLTGAIVFEVIIELILAFFTGGTANVAKVIGNITRVANKAVKAGIKVAQKTGKAIATKADDIYKLLRKQLEELIQAISNGKFIQWLREKIIQLFGDSRIISGAKRSADDLIAKYGNVVQKGKGRFGNSFSHELRRIERRAEIPTNTSKFKKDFAKKKRKISEEAYIRKRKTLFINSEKGAAAERLFLKTFKGTKPSKSVKTALTNRFTDNVLNGVGKEIKSGYIKNTKAFQKQVLKDIDIIARRIDDDIAKIEWHLLNGISDDAIEFIIKSAKQKDVLDLFKIIIH